MASPERYQPHPSSLALDYPAERLPQGCSIVNADCFDWLKRIPENSLHSVVTDPPYGVLEFDADHLEKRQRGVGGIWRIPPSFDGHQRAPLPRFTALNAKERDRVRAFFAEWSEAVLRAIRPGAHVFVASNAFLSQLVFESICRGGLEFRGEIIRLVGTLRGGDRPKGAEAEFPDVCSLPRGAYEPWGLFRKPIPARLTVAQCLREFETGALRRTSSDSPFSDVLPSERTPRREREIVNHPSLKPQSILRPLVRASLPLGRGTVCDPFAGSGSTVAAAMAQGLSCIGIERSKEFFDEAVVAIPCLAKIETGDTEGQQSLTLFG